MYNAILFDLDDTLLQLSTGDFVKTYFQLIQPVIGPHIGEEQAVEIIQSATAKMINASSDGPVLEKVFEEYFNKVSPKPYHELYDVFMQFYKNQFPKMQKQSRQLKYANAALQAAEKITDNIVVATIPIFPKIAIQERLLWAGIEYFPFTLITSFENMHCSKPNPDYFSEIADKLGVNPKTCLMIGNDHSDDMAAKAAGMTTFLVTDFQMNEDKQQFPPDYRGTLKELADFLSGIQS